MLTVLHSGEGKEVRSENEATLQVRVGGLLCVCHTVGGLEYCCTMVYLPFLLQYNLLKLSVNKTEFWYQRPAVSEQAQCLLVCVCFNCMSTLDGKVFRVHFMQGQAQSSMYSHRSFSQPSCTCCNKTLRRLSQYLYLSWTFCFISCRESWEISRSRQPESTSVAFSRSA